MYQLFCCSQNHHFTYTTTHSHLHKTHTQQSVDELLIAVWYFGSEDTHLTPQGGRIVCICLSVGVTICLCIIKASLALCHSVVAVSLSVTVILSVSIINTIQCGFVTVLDSVADIPPRVSLSFVHSQFLSSLSLGHRHWPRQSVICLMQLAKTLPCYLALCSQQMCSKIQIIAMSME